MQRIIKFRGKRVDNGEWVYGYYTEDVQWDVDDNSRIEVHYIRQLSKDGEFYEEFEVDPKTVGQFTGLISKNGKRIYEGDIVNIPLFGNSIIIWNKSISAFQYAYHAIGKGTSIGGRMTNTLYSDEQPKYEVIGNIHEDGGLLEK